MAIRAAFPPEQTVPIREQIALMKLHFPNFQTRWRKNLVTSIGDMPKPCWLRSMAEWLDSKIERVSKSFI